MENYKNLFEQIKQFKKEQEKQKQRGLNNYNILTTVLKQHDEVRLHSRMIASFLDPFGEHYQSNLFLDKFLEVLDVSDFKINAESCYVYKEYQNIDLYITDGDKHIIIENKIYAKDQENQIKRYIEIIKKENRDLKYNDILVIYLSLDRKEPTESSLGNLSIGKNIIKENSEDIALFKSIHYKNEILDWLEKCKYEVQNITNLNEVFRQYIDVVKMINNQYEEKIMSFSEYIAENKEMYKLATEIEKEMPEIRKKSFNIFLDEIFLSLKDKLGNEWEVILNKEGSSKQYSVPLEIYKRNWVANKEKNLVVFGIGFNEESYYDGYFGIIPYENIDKDEIIEKFCKKLKKLNYETVEDWLHLEWMSHSDFIEYIQLNENAKEEFVDKLINLIEKFELNSNLMTEINSYLNNKT